MTCYKITFQRPDEDEPNTTIIHSNDIEASFTELENANPKVEFLSYEEIEEDEDNNST